MSEQGAGKDEAGRERFTALLGQVTAAVAGRPHMQDVMGPHHRHPNGEIDMVMPITPGAAFDGNPAGWCVYGPGSAHHPTVTEGAALVLYLLPDGAIEFTKS